MEGAWTTGSLGYTIEGLTAGAQYDIQVRAVNSVGAGPWSVISSGVPQTTPGTPVIGSLTPGDGMLTVEWSAPMDDGGTGITGYDLRFIRSDALDKADANGTARSSIWSSGGLRYSLGGLTNDVAYDVQVRAVNLAGTGPWSETIVGTPATWWAIRSLSPERVEPGGEVEVTITAAVYGAVGQIVETLPAGFSYVGSDLASAAVQSAGQEVSFALVVAPITVTYTVTAPRVEGPYSFSGVLTNADTLEKPVGGSSSVTVSAGPGVDITRTAGPLVRINLPVPVTVTFSEPVSGFTVDTSAWSTAWPVTSPVVTASPSTRSMWRQTPSVR